MSAMRFAEGTASGFGRVFAIFGARTAFSAPTLPLPLRSRNRANAGACKLAHQRAGSDPDRAALRHEGAHILRLEFAQRCKRGRLA